MLAGGFFIGCGSAIFGGLHIGDIEVSPRVLPAEGGTVWVKVKTKNAKQVRALVIYPDNTQGVVGLEPVLTPSVLLGEQKWKGEIRLPPNNDPEGNDRIYTIFVRAWRGYDFETAPAGEVIVKGKKSDGDISAPLGQFSTINNLTA